MSQWAFLPHYRLLWQIFKVDGPISRFQAFLNRRFQMEVCSHGEGWGASKCTRSCQHSLTQRDLAYRFFVGIWICCCLNFSAAWIPGGKKAAKEGRTEEECMPWLLWTQIISAISAISLETNAAWTITTSGIKSQSAVRVLIGLAEVVG